MVVSESSGFHSNGLTKYKAMQILHEVRMDDALIVRRSFLLHTKIIFFVVFSSVLCSITYQ